MEDYVLYILPRTDLDSMTPGRIAAQVSHATSMFHENTDKKIIKLWAGVHEIHELTTYLDFGTVIVLNGGEMNSIMNLLDNISKEDLTIPIGLVRDPTYLIQDGEVTHFVDIYTCGYVLINKNDSNQTYFLKDYELL